MFSLHKLYLLDFILTILLSKKGYIIKSEMFFKKKVQTIRIPEGKTPAIRVSICTGEQVAGFKNLSTGKFEEITLIRDRKDLEDFKRKYGLDKDPDKFY
jgi:hypothetical protein